MKRMNLAITLFILLPLLTCATRCISGYTLDSNSDCCYKCNANCKTIYNNCYCLSCNDGYFLYCHQCLKCNSICKTCSSYSNYCTRCNPGFFLHENYCYQTT